ncbi:Putative protein [Zobellia galactanivorans]|uniref:Uncharacterized protein n=1 Tax=Zobellia galactanivorans (strain DSM 12802 / CCUG 47099 / CIP 106680 / NCIMB 13871 / Dsij) TaxID=63186 RepID=G0L780_ZOBGA|nr:Putative protein [Zobellia galactanivorans]
MINSIKRIGFLLFISVGNLKLNKKYREFETLGFFT